MYDNCTHSIFMRPLDPYPFFSLRQHTIN